MRRILITAVISLMAFVPTFAGEWELDGKGWKYIEQGEGNITSQWVIKDGKWYYLGKDGYMAANTWVENYYVGSDGAMLTDTVTPDGYYVGTDGAWVDNRQNGYLQQISEHEQKIQHIRDIYNQTNERTDLKVYGGDTVIDYAADDNRLVKAVLKKNNYYLKLPIVEYYYEWIWKDGSYYIDLVFAYGTDGTNEYRYYFQNQNLIREIGPDGIVRDYPDGDGLSDTGDGLYSDILAERILSMGLWEPVLFMEDLYSAFPT